MKGSERILVVRLSALGDIVLTLPTVFALREGFPQAHLAMLCRAPEGRILNGVTALNDLHLFEATSGQLPEAVSSPPWDLLVDLSGTGKSRRLLSGVRARRRLTAKKQTLRRWAFVHARRWGATGTGILSARERMASVLGPLRLSLGDRKPWLLPFAKDALPTAPLRREVVLAPGGGRVPKMWPREFYGEVAAHLARRGIAVLVVGNSAERALLEEVAKGAHEGIVEILAGRDLAELPARLSGAAAAITNDSGLLHVAEACDVPVVALFGPTHPALGFAPWREDSIIVHSGISCSPCDLHGPKTCPRSHHLCLRGIEVSRVLKALEGVLQLRLGERVGLVA